MVSSLYIPKGSTPNYTWERAVFTVPKSTTNEQIDFHADKYQRKFGNHLEAQGYNVLAMGMPEENPKAFPSLPEDRRGFIIWARVSRRPQEIHIDIPDNAVEEVEKLGLKLNE